MRRAVISGEIRCPGRRPAAWSWARYPHAIGLVAKVIIGPVWIAVVVLLAGLAGLTGCDVLELGERSSATANDPVAAANQTWDRQMDELSASLGQDQEQWPVWAGDDSAASLSTDETRTRLGEAARQARDGDVAGAWQTLAGATPALELAGPWELRRAEIGSAYFYQQAAYPLSARSAAVAQSKGNAPIARELRDSLRVVALFAWKFEDLSEAGVLPAMAGETTSVAPLFRVQGYSNPGVAALAAESELLAESFHFCVFLTASRKFLSSYVVASRALPGGSRIHFLERRVGDQIDVLKVYDNSPDYATARQDVLLHLRQGDLP